MLLQRTLDALAQAAHTAGDLVQEAWDHLTDPLKEEALADPLTSGAGSTVAPSAAALDTAAPASAAAADLSAPTEAPAAEPAAVLAQVELSKGDTGDLVDAMQQLLVDAGYLTAADHATGPGTFGPRTHAALTAFQADHGLAASGVYDAATANALASAPAAAVAAPEAAASTTAEAAAGDDTFEGDVAAATDVQRAIASAAVAWSSGSSSGLSDSSGSWWSDLVGEIPAYQEALRGWHEASQAGTADDATKAQLAATFQASTDYDATRATMVLDRIAAVYSGSLPNLTEDGILSFLGYRRQCVEWVNQLAADAGGTYASQNHGTAVDWNDAKPGMGWSTADKGHYAAIVGVHTDADGKVTSLTIKESNWGTGWMNPGGMVPWERTIGQRTVSGGFVRSHG